MTFAAYMCWLLIVLLERCPIMLHRILRRRSNFGARRGCRGRGGGRLPPRGNRILLEHYYLPGDLERQVAAFVGHYNHARYHESLDNLTPADVYFGRAEAVLLERERIKRQTIANRRLQHQLHAA